MLSSVEPDPSPRFQICWLLLLPSILKTIAVAQGCPLSTVLVSTTGSATCEEAPPIIMGQRLLLFTTCCVRSDEPPKSKALDQDVVKVLEQMAQQLHWLNQCQHPLGIVLECCWKQQSDASKSISVIPNPWSPVFTFLLLVHSKGVVAMLSSGVCVALPARTVAGLVISKDAEVWLEWRLRQSRWSDCYCHRE